MATVTIADGNLIRWLLSNPVFDGRPEYLTVKLEGGTSALSGMTFYWRLVHPAVSDLNPRKRSAA